MRLSKKWRPCAAFPRNGGGVTAISNSSPLIALSHIGYLYLLRELFDDVLVPSAVGAEVISRGRGRPGAAELAMAAWITILPVEESERLRGLLRILGSGEAEVIALAE